MNLLKSLQHRPFALLWSGQTTSRLGDSLYRIAMAWWVLEKTGSAEAMGAVLIFSSVPMLIFLLIGGVVTDRLPRLRVMVTSDILSGSIVAIIALMAFTGVAGSRGTSISPVPSLAWWRLSSSQPTQPLFRKLPLSTCCQAPIQ